MAQGDVQIGRLTRYFVKWLGAKGFTPRMSFGGEIVPNLNLWSGVEDRYLQGWNRFGQSIGLTASVGNVDEIQMRNPSGSKVVAVFEKMTVSCNSATLTQPVLSVASGAADLASVQTMANARLDPRGQPTPSIVLSTTQPASPGTNLTSLVWTAFLGVVAGATTTADVILTDDQELPLLPGDAYRFNSSVANTGMFISFLWRERVLEDSELA